MDMDLNLYKRNYQGVERLDKFESLKALSEYRSVLLKKSEKEVDFILSHVGQKGLRVVEFCSGNGRLLMALALRNALARGLGIEISQDRVCFAQSWITEVGLHNVECVQGDVLRAEGDKPGSFDLAVCVTGAFGYFRVIDPGSPHTVLARMRNLLKPGAHALLELFQLTDDFRRLLELNHGPTRTWKPLAPGDPFVYQLDEFEYVSETRILRREKVFIGRDGSIDTGRTELVADYTCSEIRSLLSSHGFDILLTCGDFDGTPFRDGESPALILLVRAA